ncbi:MAG TPA: AMP-binding protein, partial [Solirubrobacterales bacterium]|nr:AMP-binding protein [Solirubrobacterales bacterium]
MPSIARRLPFGSLARRVSLGPLGTLDDAAFNLRVLVGAGVLGPQRPDHLARTLRELARWGASPAAGIATSAITDPDSAAVEDEAGSLTFSELHRRSNALTRGLRGAGVRPGDAVAIMCRNHRGFIDATLACSKLGADGLYM